MTRKSEPIQIQDLELREGSGHSSADKVYAHYWHLYVNDIRVGKIYIRYLENKIFGLHPAIDVFINKEAQGRHIGRYAYSLATQKSGLDKIYMHTRKSNLASRKAAADAGFEEVKNPEFKQVVMVWTKSSLKNNSE